MTSYVSESTRIKHQIAQKDIVQSNSMVEPVNKHLKYYYLFKKELQNLEETIAYLNQSVTAYNTPKNTVIPRRLTCGSKGNRRGNLSRTSTEVWWLYLLSYLHTPDEVLDGAIPAKDYYKTQITTTRKERTAENQEKPCCGLES